MKSVSNPQRPGTPSPSPGVFYLVPTPRGWRLLAWRYDDYPESSDHSHFWETEVCVNTANAWAIILNPENSEKLRAKLVAGLLPLYTAFPRGRIANGPRGLTIYWGENFPAEACNLKPIVAAAFGLPSKARWERDNHELCILHDFQAVRKILPLQANWGTA